MNKISRRAILEIAKTLVGSIINKVPIQQQVVQKLSNILGVQRCVIFRVGNHREGDDYDVEITAGVPIEEHGIGLKESVTKHPDIEAAVRLGKVMVIADPKTSSMTVHLRGIIEKKNITQILYLPLISSGVKVKTIGVIVLDDAGEKDNFEPEEIEFCGEVGELISLTMDREEILIQQMRDIIINRVAALGGFTSRLDKSTEEFSKGVKNILEEIRMLEESCPKGGRINF
ncbi:MAG: GAF domain-containing protein [Minisyncoccia bacterium]|jgi:GAF domain-containing protein